MPHPVHWKVKWLEWKTSNRKEKVEQIQ